MANFLVLHGPNLNLLGTREVDTYGHVSLAQIDASLVSQAESCGHTLISFQSNAEHELIDAIQGAPKQDIQCIIINPAGYTHTSVAMRDALLAIEVPFIEVHLSSIQSREPFRQVSYFSDIAVGVISGFGANSYDLALAAGINFINNHKRS